MDPASTLIKKIKDIGLDNVLGLHLGLYDAVVEDTNDPENRFRIRVIQEAIFGKSNKSGWIPSGHCQSDGQGNGIFFFPKKGQIVKIGFELGDPNHPYWVFGGVTQDQFPETLTEEKIMLLMGKNTFTLSKEDDSISILQAGGFEITLGKEGIDIKSGDTSLMKILSSFFDALIQGKILNGAGEGTLSPQTINKLKEIKSQLSKLFKS